MFSFFFGQANSPLTGKKRKREDPLNKPLPDGPSDEGNTYGNSDFNEVLDLEKLKNKSAVVNRAPIMTAWAMVVAERMGFQREEALSIGAYWVQLVLLSILAVPQLLFSFSFVAKKTASAYTDMNAISKGVSLGIYKPEKGKNMEAARSGAQPYVDLMGRR
jgi:hypothetical protein